MERNCFNISFYCRESKTDKKGFAPIEMGININGRRLFLNCPRKEIPKVFNRKRQPKEIAEYLTLMRARFNEILTNMLRAGEPITSDSVRSYLKNGGYKSYTVGNMVDGFLDIKYKEVKAGVITAEHYKKYLYAKDMFYKYISPEKEVTNITPALVQSIYADLRIKYKEETSAGYMTKIKAFIRFGVDNNKILINPLQGLKIKKGKPNIDYLTTDDIDRLCNLQIENECLDRVRDFAVFALSCGLEYADIRTLTSEDINKTDDGVYYICKTRNKTGIVYTAVILPWGVSVLHKWDFKVPVISNQKTNYYLKMVGDLCGIKKPLHTLIFRHTYATFLVNSGVSIDIVAKALGHTNSLITTKHYARLLDDTVIHTVQKVVGI